MSPVEMRTNGFEWCSKTYLGSSRAVRVQIMNSILKLVNTFCMPGSGRGGREEKTGKKLKLGKARELCRVQKLFDRDIVRDCSQAEDEGMKMKILSTSRQYERC